MKKLIAEEVKRDGYEGWWMHAEYDRRLSEAFGEKERFTQDELNSQLGDGLAFHAAIYDVDEEHCDDPYPCRFIKTPTIENGFLLSIHETEDGVVVWWCEETQS